MSHFENKPLYKVTLKSATAHQCYTYKTGSSNSYLSSPSIHNDTTSDNFRNTTYEVDVPQIDNDWEYYSG